MSSAATAGDTTLSALAQAATVECYAAICFPPSEEIAVIIPRAVGGPFAINDAAGHWRAGAGHLQTLQQQLRSITASLPAEAWTGSDREAFDAEISSLVAEIGDSHDTAEAIGIALEVLVPVLAAWPPMCAAIGTALAALAAAFVAAVASVIGDFGASESIYATGLELSETFLGLVDSGNALIIGVLAGVQAALAAAVAIDIKVQSDHGDSAIVGDLGKAEVDGIGQDVTNVFQWGADHYIDNKFEGEGDGEGAGEGDDEPPADELPDALTDGKGDGDGEPPSDGGDGTGSGDGEPPSAGGDGTTEKPPTAADGLKRLENAGPKISSSTKGWATRTVVENTTDQSQAGSRLQDLINDMSGWSGTGG